MNSNSHLLETERLTTQLTIGNEEEMKNPEARRCLKTENIRLDDGVIGGSHAGYESGTDDRGGSGIIFTNANGTTGQMAFVRKNDTNDDTLVVTESMRIDENGLLGIGTNNPSATLHASTADNIVAKFVSTDATASIELADNSTSNNAVLTRVGQTLTLCANGGNVAFGNSISSYNGAAPTNGQLLIGDTASGLFDAATLTAGANITITNAAGSITIAASGGGGGGSPAGANTQVQWNDNGAFGASADVTYDSGANEFTLGASSNRTTFAQFGNLSIGEGGDNRIGGNSLSIRSTITIIADDPTLQVGFYGSAGIQQYTVGDPSVLPPDPGALQAWLVELYNAIGPGGMNIIA